VRSGAGATDMGNAAGYNTERPQTSLDGLTAAAFATRPNPGHTESGLRR
jgi:hypothetical protein